MWQRSHWNLTISPAHVIPCWSNADDCPTHVFLILPDSQLLLSFPSLCPFISASYSLWEAFSNENIMMSVIGEHRISLIMRPWHVAGRSVMALNSRDWQSLTLLFDSPHLSPSEWYRIHLKDRLPALTHAWKRNGTTRLIVYSGALRNTMYTSTQLTQTN